MTVSSTKKPVKRRRTRKAAATPAKTAAAPTPAVEETKVSPIVEPSPVPTPIPGPDHDNVLDPDYGVQPTEDILSKVSKLRGLDFVVLPLIYLEAFVVNILMNANIDVPDRVRIKS